MSRTISRIASLLVVVCSLMVGAASRPAAAAGTITKLLVIVEENQNAKAVTSTSMPYLYSIEKLYAQATSYKSFSYVSLPNYLAIAGGSTFGVTNDNDPSQVPINAPSVFGQAINAGHSAKEYAEAATSNCDMTGTNQYAVRHNPWLYFRPSNEPADCKLFDQGFTGTTGNFANDVKAGTLPNVGMVSPNLVNDGHTPCCASGLANTDKWLKTELPFIMAGPDYTSGRLAIVITWDSGYTSLAVDFVVVAPTVSHLVVATAYNHYSLSRLLSDFGGSAPLLKAATAPDMRAAFHL